MSTTRLTNIHLTFVTFQSPTEVSRRTVIEVRTYSILRTKLTILTNPRQGQIRPCCCLKEDITTEDFKGNKRGKRKCLNWVYFWFYIVDFICLFPNYLNFLTYFLLTMYFTSSRFFGIYFPLYHSLYIMGKKMLMMRWVLLVIISEYLNKIARYLPKLA